MKATIFYNVSGVYVDPNSNYLRFNGREGSREGGMFSHNINLAYVIRYFSRMSADGESRVMTIYFAQEEQDREGRLEQERWVEQKLRAHPEREQD